jgi:hypothetical protein
MPNLDFEIIREELKKTSKTLETGNGKALRICEVHQNGSQSCLQEFFWKTALMSKHHPQAFVGDILDLGRRRI